MSTAVKLIRSYPRPEVSPRGLFVAACIVAALMLGAGCAYFNTLYNAKKAFAEAQDMPRMKDGNVANQAAQRYEEAIEKCEALIATYPKSKYVDDAVLLIGKCYYEQGAYDDAIERLDALETTSDDDKVKREGRLCRAKSYVAKDELDTAVQILLQLVEENHKKATDETYFLLGTALVKLGSEDQAVKYLEMLADRYPKSPYRVKADLEAAEVYAERQEYEKSVAVYLRLEGVGLPEREAVRYLSGLGNVYAEMGEFRKSIDVLRSLDQYVLDPTEKAADMLVMGRAFTGLDSVTQAVDTYKTVAVTYPRSLYSAEAHFRLGEIYQDTLDSLEVARDDFDQVPQQYAQSEFAEEAISRSSAISKLLRLRASIESGEGADQQMVQFDMAEIELFQFKNYAKALEGYKKILDDYPDGDLAPKAAYAVAYIYDVHLKDEAKAREAYEYILARYPDTQQAQYARGALGIAVLAPAPAESTSTEPTP